MSVIEAAATVSEWKDEQLTNLGCSTEQKFVILDNNIDWHEIAGLVNNGCPIQTAIEILR